jgi:hypothetical protein
MTTRFGKTFQRKTIAVIAIAVALLGTVALATTFAQARNNDKISAVTFHDQMRKLWEDHITWTRLVIISLVQGLPDTGSTVARLFQNQVDIGNAIKPFYGDEAGNQLTSLLHDHIALAAEILVDAKAGNTTGLNSAIGRWYANANSIASFLNSANPKNFPLAFIQSMMKSHLDLTLAEAVAYLKGDYAGSVSDYDQVHFQILHMADSLASGIIAQFPQDFTAIGLN